MKLKRNCLTFLIISILMLSFCYVHVKEAHASTFSNGFEDDFASWTSTSGSPETTTSIKYEGTKSFNHTIPSNLGSSTKYATYNMADDTDYWLEAYVYIESFNPSTFGTGDYGVSKNFCPIITLKTDGQHDVSIGIDKADTGANITVYGGDREGFQLGRGAEIQLVTWYLFKVHGWYSAGDYNFAWYLEDALQDSSTGINDPYGSTMAEIHVGSNYGCWDTGDTGNATWFIDTVDLEGPKYYFNFNFYDLESEDVELYVDWALWNSTDDINYTEGTCTLEFGTYYLKTSKYDHVINTTTLDTDTYGNSTINIYLNMKRHQSCPNGFITSNDTISSITVHAETPQLLNFTMEGTPPDQHGVGVAKNASYILRDGSNMTGWTYQSSPSHIHWDQTNGNEVLIEYHDYYTTTSTITAVHPSQTNYYSGVGQRKIPTMKGYRITILSFELDKYGNPQGNLRAIVMDSNYVIKAESHSVAMSTIPTARTFINFTFSTPICVPSTQYSIAVIAKDATVLDTNDYISVSCDGNGGYDGEDSCKIGFKNDHWYYTDTWDCCFYVYGQKVQYDYAFVFPSTTGPVVGPHTPMNNRVKVTVRLNGEWVKDCNVTVEGGPDNRIEWALTDVFGSVKFKLKTGSYEIVASYEQHRKVKPVYVSTHMTIGIDLTEEDIVSPDVLPDALEDFLTWVKLPELDLTTETFLVFILPLIVLVAYAVKKASEGPKKKWKYGYLD